MTRMKMIDLYNMATEYKITREDYINLGFSPWTRSRANP
jgi:hypothetical protein